MLTKSDGRPYLRRLAISIVLSVLVAAVVVVGRFVSLESEEALWQNPALIHSVYANDVKVKYVSNSSFGEESVEAIPEGFEEWVVESPPLIPPEINNEGIDVPLIESLVEDVVVPKNKVKTSTPRTSGVLAAGDTEIKDSRVSTYNGLQEGDILTETVISHYAVGPGGCAPYGDGKWYTADGTELWPHMDNPYIIACNWLPMGSVLEIDGIEYTVRDIGGHSRLKKVGGVDMFIPEGAARCSDLGLRRNVPLTIIYINN